MKSAAFQRRAHAAFTVLWVLLIVPSVLWWRQSVPWLVIVSVYANAAGHFAAWQAVKAEEATPSGLAT